MKTNFLLALFIILLLINCNDAKKKKKKTKPKEDSELNNPYASIYCDESGISFNLTSSFETKLAVNCVLPVMSNLKSLNASSIMSSTNGLVPKILHCALNQTKCIEEDTGKANKTCVLDLKTIFIQEEKQKIFVDAQTDCLKLHLDTMKHDYQTFKGYCDCILDKKYLKPLCPTKKITSGGFSMGNFFV